MLLKIKLHPEVMTKSDSVRKRFIKILASNIRQSLQTFGLECSVVRNWDNLLVRAKCDPSYYPAFVQIIRQVPGIQAILVIKQIPYVNFQTTFNVLLDLYKDRLVDKTFCVRVKRKGKHDFTSIDLERYLGGGLRQHIAGAKVKLVDPQEVVHVEVDNDIVHLIENTFTGMGGFPIGTQDEVLSLVSGGYDSAVSSYQMIRRGCKVHYLFFNLGGNEHLAHVKQIVRKVWQGYSASHNVRFINVDFYPIMLNISNYVSDGYTGVVLKRMFYRVADRIAHRMGVDGFVTGEALGQVSSQTLKNLRVIEQVTDRIVLRPLVSIDKEDIIRMARQIGTANLSAQVTEFCGIMGKKPTIAAELERLAEEEAKLDIEALVEQAVYSCKVEDLRTMVQQSIEDIEATKINFVKELQNNDVIIDVRDRASVEEGRHLDWPVEAMNIPFYDLSENFGQLDQRKRYVLYCAKGLLSKIQAVNLMESGYSNVAVLSKDFVLEEDKLAQAEERAQRRAKYEQYLERTHQLGMKQAEQLQVNDQPEDVVVVGASHD